MTKLTGVVVSLLIVLAGVAGAQQPNAEPRRDILILRASAQQAGELQACTGASCSFSGRPYARPEIFMLGLAVTANDVPPAVADPLQDAVYLRTAGVVKSKLVSIDARQVVTEQGVHPRANVAWVFLALATASPGTRGAWVGTFGWKHICQGGGSRDETRGTGDLTLDYDGRGNLTGTLVGSVPERTMTVPPCSSYRLVTPGTFRAKLLGSYTPEPHRFSVQTVDVQTTHGRASLTCPAGSSTFEQAYFTVYEGPMFRDAFRDLRRQPDGSLKSDGESTISVSPQTCITNYSLTLRPTQN